MSFPDPDERPGDERRLKLELSVLLGLMLITLIFGLLWAWVTLSSLF